MAKEYKLTYEPVNSIMDKTYIRLAQMLGGNSKLIGDFISNLCPAIYKQCILKDKIDLILSDKQSALLRDITATYGIYWNPDILEWEFKIKIKNLNWFIRELYKYKDLDLQRVEVH